MSIEFYDYGLYSIFEHNGQFDMVWTRGKENLSFPVSKDLIEKAQISENDALEVMFYLEHHRWPEEGELDHYNETTVITHKGNGFLVYEENGKYEMEWMTGGFPDRLVSYPISKYLMEKAFQSSQDAYEVQIYLETGHWPDKSQEESDRSFIRQFPEQILKNPEYCKKLFSEYEL